ncbi:MAG TPA: prolipoprotein diacylglyceryl transferase family protein [Rubrobacteraceae bacterium]|nr:prolipoprotein diacylglyceryl transferase family protein [Rubrobacteraceae bacterium]
MCDASRATRAADVVLPAEEASTGGFDAGSGDARGGSAEDLLLRGRLRDRARCREPLDLLRREVLGYDKGEVAKFSLVFVAGVLAGGRLFDVFLYEWSYVREHPLAVFEFWRGGMASHGVMLGAALAGAAFCLYRGKSFLALADEVVIPGAVLLGLGRIGNHINGEVFGSVTNLPWATGFPYAEGCRHPVGLYDGLRTSSWCRYFWASASPTAGEDPSPLPGSCSATSSSGMAS